MLRRLFMLSALTAGASVSADMAITVDCCAETDAKKSDRCAEFVMSEEYVVDVAAACDRPAFKFGEQEAIVSVDPSEDGVTVSLTIVDHAKLAPQTVAWGQPAVFMCPKTGATVRIVVQH